MIIVITGVGVVLIVEVTVTGVSVTTIVLVRMGAVVRVTKVLVRVVEERVRDMVLTAVPIEITVVVEG